MEHKIWCQLFDMVLSFDISSMIFKVGLVIFVNRLFSSCIYIIVYRLYMLSISSLFCHKHCWCLSKLVLKMSPKLLFILVRTMSLGMPFVECRTIVEKKINICDIETETRIAFYIYKYDFHLQVYIIASIVNVGLF